MNILKCMTKLFFYLVKVIKSIQKGNETWKEKNFYHQSI